MSDLFDTSQIRDDPRYWDALAERVAVNASREANAGGFDWLVHSRGGWVAVSLLLAAALALTLLPDERRATRSLSAAWAQAVAPADAVGRSLVLRDGPPPIGALLLGGRGGG